MKQAIAPISVILISSALLLAITWCTVTNFGKERGVYIDQKVEHQRLMDSTYTVSTYVWDTDDFFGRMGNRLELEWSSYKIVKCYDVEIEKKIQYDAAIAVQKQLRDFKKRGIDCLPQ